MKGGKMRKWKQLQYFTNWLFFTVPHC